MSPGKKCGSVDGTRVRGVYVWCQLNPHFARCQVSIAIDAQNYPPEVYAFAKKTGSTINVHFSCDFWRPQAMRRVKRKKPTKQSPKKVDGEAKAEVTLKSQRAG